jgi:LemA family
VERATQGALGRLFAVAEAYPELKADANFRQMQTEFEQIEDQLQMARPYYNGVARELNMSVQSLPGNLVAARFGFTSASYFELGDEAARRAEGRFRLNDGGRPDRAGAAALRRNRRGRPNRAHPRLPQRCGVATGQPPRGHRDDRFRVLGTQIRHGINRDFPTDYPGAWASRSTIGFVLEDIRLDGDAVPTQVSRLDKGVRIRIGDPNRLVPPGIHTYTIHYLTWWQVSFGPDEERPQLERHREWMDLADRSRGIVPARAQGARLEQRPRFHRSAGKSRRGCSDHRAGARLSRRGHDRAALPS